MPPHTSASARDAGCCAGSLATARKSSPTRRRAPTRSRSGASGERRPADLEDVVAPCGHVQIQAGRAQLVAVALIFLVTERVLEAPRPATQVRPRRADTALALLCGVIHRDQPPLVTRAGPRIADEVVVRRV